MKYLEAEAKVINKLKALNPIYKKAFIWAFALINLAFLFHTFNFMFGDHDWNYVRTPNYWSEGTFEGRPLHFVLISLLFGGHVLPVINNLFSFAALALSGILLAKYWRVPLSVMNYTLFAAFTAVLPYTMVWLFYAKDTLINLSLPLIAVTGLLLADVRNKGNKAVLYHSAAAVLFYFAFASYAAIINFLGVCFLAMLFIEYGNGKDSFFNLLKQKFPALLDMFLALAAFKVTLVLLSVNSGYNTQTLPLSYFPEKLAITLNAMGTQFITPLPFMELKYKLLLLLLLLYGVFFALKKGGVVHFPLLLVLIIGILFASKTAFFIADERGQILAEMENFAFVPRLDFYGLAYIYAFGLALVLHIPTHKFKKNGIILACILLFMSVVRDMYAQKVWKFGFDAEMKAHERIVSRLEKRPDFYPERKYALLQLGSLELRQNYYKKAPNEQISLDLLETAFTPVFMSRIVYNFYYPQDVFYNNADISALSEQGKQWILNQARPWPALESIFIDGNVVIIVLTKKALEKARSALM